ncbi:unnamed protein product [Mytilus coruscus]|uniref:Uncharacterized protein n=1 Tax=Mytilus coruscus TaxID=42192 RepID=A0A6J8C3K9_MYTCO|nr:unnamed protein product [Mytilus coruscus]
MYLYTICAIILFKKTECLIGLRPPSADPTYRRHQQLQQSHPLHSPPLPISHHQNLNETQKNIAKFILQRSYKNFVLKKDVYDSLKKISSKGTTLHDEALVSTEKRSCDNYTSLKCSIRFLKSTIREDNDHCESFQDVSNCMCPHCVTHECSIRHTLKSIADDKNCVVQSISTKGINKCCQGELLKCTIDTYLSMNEGDRGCDAITEFTTCVSRFTTHLSNKNFDRIFELLLSLTKTCIYTIKPYT